MRTLPLAFAVTLAGPLVATVAGGEARAQWNFIIGGVPAPEMESVGAFLKDGSWFCTGTVIAPRVVLTAAHCLSDLSGPSGVQFFLGADANDVGDGTSIDVTELHVHPDYAQTENADIAVAILGSDAGVDAIQVNVQALGSELVGTDITFVGYGYEVQDVKGGQKRKVVIPVSGVSDFFIDYETAGKNTCQGDSGGPAFLDDGGSLVLVGVTSYGDAACAVDGHNTRSDVFAPFVTAFLDGSWSGDSEVTDGGQVPIEPGTDPDDGEGDIDFCDAFGWYSDGVCDECPNPDPDCDGGNPDDGGEDGEFEDDEEDSGCGAGGSSSLALLSAVAFAAWTGARRRRDRAAL